MTLADIVAINHAKDRAAYKCIGRLEALVSELNWTVEFGGLSQTPVEFRDRLRSLVDRMQNIIAEFDSTPSSNNMDGRIAP